MLRIVMWWGVTGQRNGRWWDRWSGQKIYTTDAWRLTELALRS